LQQVCGLSAATRLYRRRYAREFLRWRFEGKRWDLTRLSQLAASVVVNIS
jgi:hypothetical protein